MAIVRFQCRHCGEAFDLIRQEAQPSTRPTCPGCGEVAEDQPAVPSCGMECADGGACGGAVPGFA